MSNIIYSHIVPNLYGQLSSVELKRRYFENCAFCSFPCNAINRDWTSLAEKLCSDAWFINKFVEMNLELFKELGDLTWKKERKKETIWMIYSRIWLKLLTDLVTVVSKRALLAWKRVSGTSWRNKVVWVWKDIKTKFYCFNFL